MNETILTIVLLAWIITTLSIIYLYESHLTREIINGIEAQALDKVDRRNRMRYGKRSARYGKMVSGSRL